MKSRLLGVVCALSVALSAQSATVSYDADDFELLSVVNNSIPGVTLSVVGNEPKLTGDSVIINKPGTAIPETTDYVFGYSQTNINFIDGGFQQLNNELRIDFHNPTNSVSVLFATGNGLSAFTGVIRAYNSAGTLTEEAFSDFLTPSADTSWATLTRSSNDIASIQATGTGGTIASIDVFEYNAVPIPPAVWLFASGVIGLLGMARRKASA